MARLLNWIAVILLVVLGAGVDHSTDPTLSIHTAHYETGTFDRDIGNEVFIAEADSENAGAVAHCGAPMLGLGLASLTIAAPCTAPYLLNVSTVRNGNGCHPELRPPRSPRLA